MENKSITFNGVENPTQLTLAEVKELIASPEFKFSGKDDFDTETAALGDDVVFTLHDEWMDKVATSTTDYVRSYTYQYPNPKADSPEDFDVVLTVSLRRTQQDNSLSAIFSAAERWD